jgi:NADH-quinone oxidoreductase subunit M
MKRLLRYSAWLAVCAMVVLAIVLPGRLSRAQVGGGTGPMPRRFPHAAPTPPPSSAGPAHIRIGLEDGSRGPLVMTPKNGGFIGEFVVSNDGPGPLTVSRVTTRGDDDDPRLPQRFNARFTDGGGGSSIIQPHGSKRVRITWVPDRGQKVHEAIGHVVLTSNDEAAGEVAMGFVAPLEGPLAFVTGHLLSWLLTLPLLGALLALAMHLVGYKEEERLRGVVLAITTLQCLLAILLYEGFSGIVTRVDGNDGFQFIERVVVIHSIGAEYFIGVDGMSVSLVLLTAIVGFAGAIASYGVTDGLCRYYGLFSLLLAGAMGVFVALDLSLFVACWVVMLGALAALVGAGRSRPWPRPTTKLAIYAAVSALLLAFAVSALYLHSDPTYLADGTRVEHTFAIPELMRVAYNAKHLTLLGCSWVKVVWVALFLAFAILTPLVPLHGWFIDVIGDVPAPVSAVVVGVVMKAGVYGLLRVSFGVLPDGSRWAATTIVACGVITIGFAAISALRQNDLLKVAAYATVGQLGFCLVGLGGLTREGIAGCLVQMISHGAVMALLFLLLGALRRRTKTSNLAELAGKAGGMPPLFAALTGFALLAAAGAPGLSGFWGEVMALLGTFPVQRALVTIAAVVGAITVGYHLRVWQRVLSAGSNGGGVDGAVRDLGARELAAVMPLLALALALGFYPAPFFALVRGGVSDLNQLVNPPGPDEIATIDVETAGVRPVPPSYSCSEHSTYVRGWRPHDGGVIPRCPFS